MQKIKIIVTEVCEHLYAHKFEKLRSLDTSYTNTTYQN